MFTCKVISFLESEVINLFQSFLNGRVCSSYHGEREIFSWMDDGIVIRAPEWVDIRKDWQVKTVFINRYDNFQKDEVQLFPQNKFKIEGRLVSINNHRYVLSMSEWNNHFELELLYIPSKVEKIDWVYNWLLAEDAKGHLYDPSEKPYRFVLRDGGNTYVSQAEFRTDYLDKTLLWGESYLDLWLQALKDKAWIFDLLLEHWYNAQEFCYGN